MTDRIEREVLIPAPPDEVWAVVTADGWLAEEVRLDLVPGGEASFDGRDSSKAGWIEEATAPSGADGEGGRLIFWWADDGEPASRVELELAPTSDLRTRLRIVETRPFEVLDVVGMPLPRTGGTVGFGHGTRGPALTAVR